MGIELRASGVQHSAKGVLSPDSLVLTVPEKPTVVAREFAARRFFADASLRIGAFDDPLCGAMPALWLYCARVSYPAAARVDRSCRMCGVSQEPHRQVRPAWIAVALFPERGG